MRAWSDSMRVRYSRVAASKISSACEWRSSSVINEVMVRRFRATLRVGWPGTV
ncbi:Uncharacterised protein [Mycobacteroides abscessus subsp. abscessus]|nr:Uncharacterised protein [Mycobacteroides abscessus subsp. abscessus]